MYKRYFLGNLLILASLALIVFTYLPLIQFFLPVPVASGKSNYSFGIYIPKINADAPIVPDVDPWNKSNYLPALKKGVAMAKGSSLPGQDGTTYLFAHSSLSPWEMTRVNTAFLRLGELKKGDEIIIYFNETKFVYKVVDKKELWPADAGDLVQSTSNRQNRGKLILQTCVPLGTDLKRLLIFAEELRPADPNL